MDIFTGDFTSQAYKDWLKQNGFKPQSNRGALCGFCENKERILTIATDYIKLCQSDSKPRVPFLNELALKIGVHRETMANWRNPLRDFCKANHAELFDILKILETMQEFRLQQAIMGRYNPTGKIFLLKTKHGYIETEKQIHAGDQNAPVKMEIEITEARHVEEN